MCQDIRRTFDTVEPTSDHEKVSRRKIYEDIISVDVIVAVLGSERTGANGISTSGASDLDRKRRRVRRANSVTADSCQIWSVNVERDYQRHLAIALKAQADE